MPTLADRFTVPPLDAQISAGDSVEVVRVTEDFIIEDEPIPFESLWQPSDELEIDTTGFVQGGQEGVFRRRRRFVSVLFSVFFLPPP